MSISDAIKIDSNNNQYVTQGTLLAGENPTLGDAPGRMQTAPKYLYSNIVAATTTTVKSGAGVLGKITVNTAAAGAVTIYDNTTGTGTKIGTLKASVVEATYTYDVAFNTGLTLITSAATDLTVSYL